MKLDFYMMRLILACSLKGPPPPPAQIRKSLTFYFRPLHNLWLSLVSLGVRKEAELREKKTERLVD